MHDKKFKMMLPAASSGVSGHQTLQMTYAPRGGECTLDMIQVQDSFSLLFGWNVSGELSRL
jgi:hypothetical protein